MPNGNSHSSVSLPLFIYMQLNDFNRGRFIRWNEVKQETCPFYIGSSPGRVSIVFFHEINSSELKHFQLLSL